MRIILLFLYLFFFFSFIWSQEKDNLCEVWQKKTDYITDLNEGISNDKMYLTKVDEKCKIRIYIDLGNIYLNKVKMDSALFYIDTAIALGKKINADEELVFAYTEKTNILISLNRYAEVQDLLKKSRALLKKYPKSKSWLHYYDKMGYMQYVKSEYYKALDYMDSTIIVARHSGLLKEMHQTYEHKGVLYMRLSEYEKAIENFINSLKLKQENNLTRDLSSTYRYLASCFFKMGQYDKAKKYIVEALEFGKLNNNSYAMMISYTKLAAYNRLMNLTKESETAVDQAIKLSKESGADGHIATALEEKGLLYLNNYRDLDKAEAYFLEAYEFAKRTKQDEKIYYLIQSLIELYTENRNTEKLKKFIKQLEPIVERTPKKDYKVYIEKVYSRYYEHVNNYKKSLSHLKTYHKLKDSIENAEVSVKVAALERQYDSQKKELKIASLTKEKREQEQIAARASLIQNLYLIATVILLLLLGIGYWVFRKLRKQQRELRATNQVKNRLFSIIAHDLRGMMIPFQRSGKILKYHIDKGNHERTIELSNELEKSSQGLSNMLDNLLNWSLEQMNGYKMNPEIFSIQGQLQEIISNFKQQASYKNTTIELQCEEGLSINFDKGAFHVIFRNLIGNALKYTEKGTIRISCKKDFNALQFSVTDTGVGMSETQLNHVFTLDDTQTTLGTQGEKGTGLGLNLVYRFVKMHKGTITVSSEKRIGTQFDITFPVSQTSIQKPIENQKALSA